MKILAGLIAGIVAILHTWFMIAEMFFWNHPIGYRMFGTTEDFASQTAFMASNQGLYNGFIVAGLVWGRFAGRRDVLWFFLICVIVAGVWGAMTVSPTIFYVQAVPAIIALFFSVLASRSAKVTSSE